jgi:hypothetical protein
MKDYRPRFSWQPEGKFAGVILDRGKKVAEIVDGRIKNGVLRPDGPIVFDNDVGLRMFWMQYALHELPGRSADIVKHLVVEESSPTELKLLLISTNIGETIESRYQLTLAYAQHLCSYYYHCKAVLSVLPGRDWVVTHNPQNGELEFCNFWPKGVFEKEKLWSLCCYEANTGETLQVPHHHLNSSDKILRQLRKQGRILYVLEDDNPTVQLLGDTALADTHLGLHTAGGLCAYMYDLHLAYRVCDSDLDVVLPAGSTYKAEFAIYNVGREEGSIILQRSRYEMPPEVETIPIFTEGLNSFSKTIENFGGNLLAVWPWSMEYGENWNPPHGDELEGLECGVDRQMGYTDLNSLKIGSNKACKIRWTATTIGPSYFGKDFVPGARHRLTAYARTKDVSRKGVAIAIRIYQENREGSSDHDVSDPRKFEAFYSPMRLLGTNDWIRLEVSTPSVMPKPDRVHLILELEGTGTVWFDDVEYRELSDDVRSS